MDHDSHFSNVVDFYNNHPINEQQIVDKLAEQGIDLDNLTEDILQQHDMDHYGGVEATDVLARAAGVNADSHVLDVASGMGGGRPAIWHTTTAAQ